MTKNKIWLSAGHTNVLGKDRGASAMYEGKKIHEGEEIAILVSMVHKELVTMGANVEIDDFKNELRDTIKAIEKKVKRNDIAADFHFNASDNPKATGTETFVPERHTRMETAIAKSITLGVAEVLKIPIRGGDDGFKTESESARKKLGFLHLNCQTILLEICFLSNPNNMTSFYDNLPKLAKKIAEILFYWANK